MQHYGGIRDAKGVRKRLDLAIDHHKEFGYGLWSLYKVAKNDFIGIAGIIHYDFDFTSEKLECVICLKRDYQNSIFGAKVISALWQWYAQFKVDKPLEVRIEQSNKVAIRIFETMSQKHKSLAGICYQKSIKNDDEYIRYSISHVAKLVWKK